MRRWEEIIADRKGAYEKIKRSQNPKKNNKQLGSPSAATLVTHLKLYLACAKLFSHGLL